MKVDQMTKTSTIDDDVWVLRNPSNYNHQRQRIKPGNNERIFSFLYEIIYSYESGIIISLSFYRIY